MPLDAPLLPQANRRAEGPYEMNIFLKEAYGYWNKGAFCTLAREVADLAIAFSSWFSGCSSPIASITAARAHLSTPQCPDGTSNDAPIFSRDCYGIKPIELGQIIDMGAVARTMVGACALLCIALSTLLKLPRCSGCGIIT